MTVALFFIACHDDGTGGFWAIVSNVNVFGVVIYFVLGFISTLIRALRYQILLRHASPTESLPRYPRLVLISAVRDALVDFLPARLGESSYFYLLTRSGISLSTGLFSFAVCSVLDVLVLLGIILPLLFVELSVPSWRSDGFSASAISVCIGAAAFLCVAGMLLIQNLSVLFAVASRFFRLAERRVRAPFVLKILQAAVTGFEHMEAESAELRASGALARLLHTTFWLRFTKYAALYVLLLAVVSQWNLGVSEVPPLVSIASFITAEASASLPVSGLMGFGAYEGSWSWALGAFGIQIPGIIKVALLVHVITQVRAYSLAAIAMVALFVIELRGGNLIRECGRTTDPKRKEETCAATRLTRGGAGSL